MIENPVFVFRGDALASYGFGHGHPFGLDRHDVFQSELVRASLGDTIQYANPQRASVENIALFHTPDYIERVIRKSQQEGGYLDDGDTPSFPGVFESASDVVGSTLAAVDAVMTGEASRAFVPIAGLHHAAPDGAAGFCVFNDCGVAIEHLRKQYGIRRIAYIDIDAHHGDGVFYAYEDDPDVIFADLHEDGRYLYPGTGSAEETGKGKALGSKLNIPMQPGAGDSDFATAWTRLERFVEAAEPEFILFQCGADSLSGDPITHLEYSEDAHGYAASRLCALADRCCSGRIIGTGGGGYNRQNLARAWTRVVESFSSTS